MFERAPPPPNMQGLLPPTPTPATGVLPPPPAFVLAIRTAECPCCREVNERNATLEEHGHALLLDNSRLLIAVAKSERDMRDLRQHLERQAADIAALQHQLKRAQGQARQPDGYGER
jgi:hypothetical protein